MTGIRIPTRTSLIVTDGPYNADPSGVTDSSAAFTAFVGALSASGTTRNGYVPKGIYQVVDCYVPSNVTLVIEAGTVFKFPSGTLATDCAVFRLHTSDRTSTAYISNVRILGLGTWTIDLSGYTPPGGTLPRGIMVLNASDFEVTNVTGNGIGGIAGNTIMCGANQALTRAVHGRFTNIAATGVRGIGSSCVQFLGGYDIEAVGLRADGGVPARIECDGNAGDIAEQIHMRQVWLTNESGFANTCGYFQAHTNTIRNCSITGFRTDTSGRGVASYYSPGGMVTGIHAADGRITGGGKAVAFTSDLGAVPYYPSCVFERITSENGTAFDQAFDIVDGVTYRDCHATSGAAPGFGAQNTVGGSQVATPAAASKVVLDNCTSMMNTPYGVWAAGVERVVIRGGVYNDTAARIAATAGSNLVPNPGFETNTTGWSANALNCSITRVTTQHNTGVASLQITPVGNGDANAKTTTGTGGIAVTAGHTYLVTAYAKAGGGTARSVRVNIFWYKADGTFIIATSATANTLANSSTWTLVQGITTAPALSAFAAVIPIIVAATSSSDIHYIDDVTMQDDTGASTQNYGLRVDTGTTASLIGADMTVNKIGRFTSTGTVTEATVATVTS